MKSKKLLIGTVILIAISFSMITWISMSSLNTVIEGNDEEMSKVLTSKIYDSINNMLSEPIIVSQTMSNDYYLIEPLRENDFPKKEMEAALLSYLNTLSGGMGYNSAFVVSEKNRAYYSQKGFNKFVSPETDEHDVWYSLFIDSGKKYDFDVDTDEVYNNAWTVFVNCRIEDTDGSLLGVCGVSVVMTDLQDMLCAYEEEYGIKINLVNREGLVQVDTNMINIENAVLDTYGLDVGDSNDYIYQEKDDGGYIVSKYVENLGWYLVVQSDGGNNDQIYLNLLYKNVLISAGILIICMITVSSNIMIDKRRMEDAAREKEQYAQEQETLKIKAEAASRAKGEFLAKMSHEIRTPINTVLGMDEMILRESSDPVILEYAADIKRAGTTLLLLINDVLDFSKIENGKMDIIPVDYDLRAAIGDIVTMMRPRIKDKNLDLELQIDPDTPTHLHGDEIRLKQIIINLMTNAVKYTEKGRILLSVSGEKTDTDKVMLYMSVKDTGIGIKPEEKEKLFDAFQRVDESRNRNIEGSGLGLSITTRLLELMGSSLHMESIYGVGSDFCFYLEQVRRDEQVIGDFEKDDKHITNTVNVYTGQFTAPNAKILAVDDNLMNLKVFTGLLKGSEMQIDTAMSGKECLELLKQKSYHIVFLDYRMPEMDGIAVLKRAKELDDSLSTDAVMVALTANVVSGTREMFLEQGFDDYLPKPIIASELEEVIRRHLPRELIVQTRKNQTVQTAEDRPQQEPGKELVDWNKGIKQSMNDESFYRELLLIFLDSHSDEELSRLYENNDWENYLIKVHAIKTNLANIAATEASTMAKQLEYALKNNHNTEYVRAHHDGFILMYRRIQEHIKSYLSEEKHL